MLDSKLKIDNVETFLLDVPTIRPHVLAMVTMNHQSMVILRITFSDGTQGIGEATTIGGLSYGGESPESIKLTLDKYIAPILLEQDYKSVGATMSFIKHNIVANRFAKCAVEMALYDALGHRLGVSVSELLGGRVLDRLAVLWVLASGKLETDIDEAQRMIDSRRHNVFKIKIGKRSVDQDVAHVAAIKRAIGDAGRVQVDVNQAWTRAQANRGARMLADAGIELLEQPLVSSDVEGAQHLVSLGVIPIMLDESVQGPKVALDLVRAKAADIYAIKILQAGGLTEAQEVISVAKNSGAGLYGGTMLESPVSTIAAAQLFSTFDAFEWGTELFSPLLQKDSFINESLDYSDFQLTVPTGPGLGISLDQEKVDFYKR
ncbi:MAG: muconate cycloisomerase [Arenicella sp.]|nr:muconate cycloisomerase [Arenicella sp.]